MKRSPLKTYHLFSLTAEERQVCSLIRSDKNVKADAVDTRLVSGEGFWQWARRNEVVSQVYHALVNREIQHSAPAWVSQEHGLIQARITSYLDEMDRVGEALASSGIPLVALKNAGIARGMYPCAGCCPMGDVDLLVEKENFRAAHQVLLSQGYHFQFRSSLEEADEDAAEASGGAEYWKILPGGEKLWLELQWRPVAGRWIGPEQEPPARELMARSQPIPGSFVRLLAPEDNLIQVALHTAKHSYVRAPGFRLHTDVDRIVSMQSLDWEIFLARVKTLRVKTAVYFSLAIPQAIFDTPVPPPVLDALRPPAWKTALIARMIQRAGLFNPDQRKFGRVGYIFFNALLYDDTRLFWRGVFPASDWMKKRYGFRAGFLIPYYHLRRLTELAFRRART